MLDATHDRPAPVDMAVAEGVLAGVGISFVGPNPRHA